MAAVPKRSNAQSNTRITVGDYIADILVDARKPAELSHWIVQRKGSSEILHWGQEESFAEAERAAIEYLQRLDERERNQA